MGNDDGIDLYIAHINAVIQGKKMEDYQEDVASNLLIMLTLKIGE